MDFQIYSDRFLTDICIWQFSDRIPTHLRQFFDTFFVTDSFLTDFWQISDRFPKVLGPTLNLSTENDWRLLLAVARWKYACRKCYVRVRTGWRLIIKHRNPPRNGTLPLMTPTDLSGYVEKELSCGACTLNVQDFGPPPLVRTKSALCTSFPSVRFWLPPLPEHMSYVLALRYELWREHRDETEISIDQRGSEPHNLRK